MFFVFAAANNNNTEENNPLSYNWTYGDHYHFACIGLLDDARLDRIEMAQSYSDNLGRNTLYESVPPRGLIALITERLLDDFSLDGKFDMLQTYLEYVKKMVCLHRSLKKDEPAKN